jgi:hypothetical protein
MRWHATPTERDAACKTILEKMGGLDVAAFCIMDYWTFDGYLTLREYIQRHPDEAKKRVFPGIELRMAAPTNFRLNTHVLLSDEVTPENLAHFISHLKLADYGSKPPTRQQPRDESRAPSGASALARPRPCLPALVCVPRIDYVDSRTTILPYRRVSSRPQSEPLS